MNISRFTAVIAASAIGLSLLAGCGTDSSKTPVTQEQTTAGTQSERTSEAVDPAIQEDPATQEDPAAQQDFSDQEMTLDPELNDVIKQVTYGKTADEWDLPMTGCILTIPESFHDLKGQVFADDAGETNIGSDVFHCRLFYVPAPDENREALVEAYNSYVAESVPDDGKYALVAKAEDRFAERGYMPFLDLLVFRETYSLDRARSEALISEDTAGKSIDLGQKGSYKYYGLTRDYSSMAAPIRESFTEEYYDEFMALVDNAEQIAANITPAEPHPLREEASEGAAISFETTDLDGNAVSDRDLFAGHKVTMINIWATWCGPCVEELAELEELGKEFEKKGCRIIGICDDTADDPTAREQAKAILAEKGVTYINLVQTEEMREQLPTSVYPISYFVDSEGRILGSPERGANLKMYGARLDKILKDMNE